MSSILIQWLDSSGWTTTRNIDAAGVNGAMITRYMEESQEAFPGKRIRAVDEDGRLIDILS